MAALYDTQREVMPSPVVDLNRAVAHSMAFGPKVGLKLLSEIDKVAELRNYAPLPAARGISCSGPASWLKPGPNSSAPPLSPATDRKRSFFSSER